MNTYKRKLANGIKLLLGFLKGFLHSSKCFINNLQNIIIPHIADIIFHKPNNE